MAGGRYPWLDRYDPGLPESLTVQHRTGLDLFRVAAARPERPLLRYFDTTLTAGQIDSDSSSLAAALAGFGVGPGERVAIVLQNVPQWPVGLVAAWKAGAIVVPVNPMLKERELAGLLADSGARVVIALESLRPVVAAAAARTGVRAVITTSELDYLGTGPVPQPLGGARRKAGPSEWQALIEAHRGAAPPDVAEPEPDDCALLCYTSGTTGPPKGAMNTHRNLVFSAQVFRDWMRLTPTDSCLGVAPLFHITGLVAHLAVSLLVPMPLVLGFRFDPGTMLDLIERWRPTFTVGAVPVFIALSQHPSAGRRDLSSLTKVISGGAPVPAAVVDAFERQFGAYIHNGYGLTETTSPSHLGPVTRRAPVDPVSGALSVGVPVFDTVARIVDDAGRELSAGEIGEILIRGPQVVPGYWNQPAETANALAGGELRTGDVGFMDADGWFYVVDRKKDQINAAGFKIWPREVEDVLYQHAAVREAAVVGTPDPYRGETVRAFVSLKPGCPATSEELAAHCRERLAAYKCPRLLTVLRELPKTASGKILRRELRDRG